AGDTAAFLIGFFGATLLPYAQNVLYFSSATMAYHDLFGSLESRTGITRQSATRLQEVDRLARVYVGKFLAPDGKWSHPASLAAAGGLLIAAALHGLGHRLRCLAPPPRPRRPPPGWSSRPRSTVLSAGCAPSIARPGRSSSGTRSSPCSRWRG